MPRLETSGRKKIWPDIDYDWDSVHQDSIDISGKERRKSSNNTLS